MNAKSLTVFMPLYNEEQIIDSTISTLLKVVNTLTDDYEILLINDGSTDSSKDKILRWVEQSNRIKLINHNTNLGYGLSLGDGFSNAQKDYILYTDADMPVDLNEIRKVLPLMERYELVIGYRVNRDDTLRRFVYSKIYNFLLRVLLNVKARDANFSFKCVRKAALAKINLNAKSVFIDGELLAEAVRNKFTIMQIPLVYRPRKYGHSSFDSLPAAMFALKELLAYWLRKRLMQR